MKKLSLKYRLIKVLSCLLLFIIFLFTFLFGRLRFTAQSFYIFKEVFFTMNEKFVGVSFNTKEKISSKIYEKGHHYVSFEEREQQLRKEKEYEKI